MVKTETDSLLEQKSQPKKSRKLLSAAVAVGILAGGASVAGKQISSLHQKNKAATEHIKQLEAQQSQAFLDLTVAESQIKQTETQLNTLASIIATQAGVKVDTVKGNLASPDTLPGIEVRLTPEQREQFNATTVKMGKRPKGMGSETAWSEICTANKIQYNGKSYVTTAAHCFSEREKMDPVAGIVGKGGGDFVPQFAFDITNSSDQEYAILDSNMSVEQRATQPLALVSRAVVSNDGTDIALFEITPNEAFDAMPALQITDEQFSPVQGQEVALRSMPQSSGNIPIETTGMYLGRLSDGYSIGSVSSQLDIVGVRGIDAESVDPCMYGASGSSALTAEGYVLGPLAYRNQATAYTDGTREGVATPDQSLDGMLRISDRLGLELSSFDTICGFTVVQPNTMNQLVNAQPIATYVK